MHQLDAAVNGIAFIALLVGLAVGWRRSQALRDTMVELFLPQGQSVRSSEERNTRLAESRSAITITWRVYQAQSRHALRRDEDVEDTEALNDLRQLVGV
jgi:hypothetical protein